jgi:hypothetical protein
MYRERIRATPLWKKGDIAAPRYDCVLINKDASLSGFRGMLIARVRLLFSFTFNETEYPCALVEWFEAIADEPDVDTGLWMVRPELNNHGRKSVSVIHLDCVLRGAHLLPVFNDVRIPHSLHYSKTVDAFRAFYVNKYIDHHAFEILS